MPTAINSVYCCVTHSFKQTEALAIAKLIRETVICLPSGLADNSAKKLSFIKIEYHKHISQPSLSVIM